MSRKGQVTLGKRIVALIILAAAWVSHPGKACAGDEATQYRELYVHGIYSNGNTWEEAIRYRVQDTGRQGLIYIPKGSIEIEGRLYLPGQNAPLTFTLQYSDNQSRDHALEKMEPLHAVRSKGYNPQIIAPTMPGEGEFSWENNTKVVEGWVRTLGGNNTVLNMLGNSQAVPIVLSALENPQNYGLVKKFNGIDPAFGSSLATFRQNPVGKAVGIIPGVPGIGDALKDNEQGRQVLEQIFSNLDLVDRGVDITFLNTRSGVVNQDRMRAVVGELQGMGVKTELIEDPNLLYEAPQPPPGYDPDTNKGFIEFNQVPEITKQGPHGAGQFIKYANFDVLFKGMQIPRLSNKGQSLSSGLAGTKDLSPFRDEQKKYVPDDGGGGGGGGGAIGTSGLSSLPHTQSGVAIIRQSLGVEDKSIPVNPDLEKVRDAAVGKCPSGQVVCSDVPLP